MTGPLSRGWSRAVPSRWTAKPPLSATATVALPTAGTCRRRDHRHGTTFCLMGAAGGGPLALHRPVGVLFLTRCRLLLRYLYVYSCVWPHHSCIAAPHDDHARPGSRGGVIFWRVAIATAPVWKVNGVILCGAIRGTEAALGVLCPPLYIYVFSGCSLSFLSL